MIANKKKIQRVQIKNFQAHRSLDLQLDPYITTILGPSDVGKSALLRAIRWVCSNKPGGKGFITKGARMAKVRIQVDGVTIERRRGPSKNEYRVDGEVFRSFSTEPPRAVTNILRIEDDQFQRQHGHAFWLELTGGALSKRLNEIIDLEVIDAALSEASKRTKSAKTVLSGYKGMLEDAQDAAKSLRWIEKAKHSWDRIKQKREEIQRKKDDLQKWKDLLQEVQILQKDFKQAKKKSLDAKKIVQKVQEIQRMEEEFSELKTIAKEAEALTAQLKAIRKRKVQAERKWKILQKNRCPLCEK